MSDFLTVMAERSRARVVPTSVHLAAQRPRLRHGLIAEVKRTSPSDGALAPDLDPVTQARAYVAGGAVAISVLTEPSRFGGSLDDLRAVARAVDVPVMRKDFITHPDQVREAAACGASLVLLVVRILDDPTLDACIEAAEQCGLQLILEAFDEADLARCEGRHQGHLVGVNCRDLATLQVRSERFAALAAHLPEGCVAVAESGMLQPEDCRRARHLGYPVALVGTALMRSGDPALGAERMGGVRPSFRVKVCGITREVDADVAIEAGADALGIVTCPSSRQVSPERARALLQHVGGRATVLAVEREVDSARVEFLLSLGFDGVQARGAMRHPRVLPVARDAQPFPSATVLFDVSEGTGRSLDAAAASELVATFPGRVHLAGGLSPENVASCIAAARPHGVDASSSLEQRPGVKAHERVRAFVRAARVALGLDAPEHAHVSG